MRDSVSVHLAVVPDGPIGFSSNFTGVEYIAARGGLLPLAGLYRILYILSGFLNFCQIAL